MDLLTLLIILVSVSMAGNAVLLFAFRKSRLKRLSLKGGAASTEELGKSGSRLPELIWQPAIPVPSTK